MRPEARRRLGYYPCPAAAMDVLARYLSPDDPNKTHILDPCAGEGIALKRLGIALGIPEKNLWAIELDRQRGETLRGLMPEAKVLSPCSFFDAGIRARSLSLIYCNPPFDDSAAVGKRIEEQFLERMGWLLVENGVLAFVCPAHVTQRASFRLLLREWFYDLFAIPWPEGAGSSGEMFIVGRARALPEPEAPSAGLQGEAAPLPVPKSPGCGQKFKKTGLTEEEIELCIGKSPLLNRLVPQAHSGIVSPPMALGTGHLALLLASGVLDGIVQPPGEPPHIVRGTVRKVEHEIEKDQVLLESGQVKTTTKFAERIELTVRALCVDGTIRDFSQGKKDG